MSPNRTFASDDSRRVNSALTRLHRAGWSIGDTATKDAAGQLVWFVAGSNGENLIRAKGATAA